MVFVLSKNKKPLMPCHYARARTFLKEGRAVVHKRYPFTIRLKDRREGDIQSVRVKLDPGSKTTGVALESKGKVLFLADMNHKTSIKANLDKRRGYRRRRRSANLRYRAPRFHNRRKSDGWLPPSLQARVDSVVSLSTKLSNLCPISNCSLETVRFDTQKLLNQEVQGVEYQQGTLFGYEVKEYLLDKWGRKCAYCKKENIPLDKEHITPRGRGGTDRVSNLTLSCKVCNQKKGNRNAEEFGHPEVQKQAQRPLKDTAAVNSTRKAIYRELAGVFRDIEVSTGGRTKYNRERLNLPKTHYFDALCVGEFTPDSFRNVDKVLPLSVRCRGRGQYQSTNVDSSGFPRGHRARQKMHFGFQTGDMVRAVVPSGKKTGLHVGRVLCRVTGSFDLQTKAGRISGISYKHCILIQRRDGYAYT